MVKNDLPETLRKTLVTIMRDQDLAKFGDSLTNFLYSLAKTNALDKPVGLRVFDKALAEAIHKTGLRKVMPSSSSSGDIGDGVEALIGYAYLNDLMTINEMVVKLQDYLATVPKEQLTERKFERTNMAESFIVLVEELKVRISKTIE